MSGTSDSVYSPGYNLDLVDEAWLADSLSDDEVELPAEIDITLTDDQDLDAQAASTNEKEKWTDLALDTFSEQ